MLPAKQARGALQCLNKARRFSSSAPAAALSPYRKTTQTTTSKTGKEVSKRGQATQAAATHERPVAAPAFNIQDTRYNDVQPLNRPNVPELDHSFVGMKGGEIFHEMMLRQGVKHVCMYFSKHSIIVVARN